jgi:transcription antitermination factor NusB
MLEEQNPTNKHVARFIAILSLYSYEMQDQKSLYQISKAIKKAYLEKDVFDLDINEEKLSEIQFHSFDEQLLEILINLSDSKKEAIEQLIKDNLIAKYNFDRLDKVIKAILRLAALELLYCGDIAAKIIIDEYVSLTKTFYENNEAGFINKVIDVMARKTRASEIE